jgi:hypothetical protein
MAKYKRGYENGQKVIEIYDGKVDLVLYHETNPSFYFYRFDSKDIFTCESCGGRGKVELENYMDSFGNREEADCEECNGDGGLVLGRDVNCTSRYQVEHFLSQNGGYDYHELIQQLLETAWKNNMRKRDEM